MVEVEIGCEMVMEKGKAMKGISPSSYPFYKYYLAFISPHLKIL
jgi:hypothetical protein